MADYLLQEGGAVTDHLLLEGGGQLLLETSGSVLLEASTPSSSGKFSLEDGSGFVILEAGAVVAQSPQGGFVVSVRRPARRLRIPDDDELIALSLALRAVRRRRSN